MAKRPSSVLTKLELQVMQVIWRLGPSTVSTVQEGLKQQLAYTTVQTMLNILERKAQLKRERRGRAFVYSAAVSQTKATGQVLREFIDRMFGGSSEELVMSLVKTEHINATQLAELTRRLDQEQDGQS